ncbi:MAG: 30S ribosomal protein S8 [Sedimentisphaerales bacterium]|nr:30S ribosomal protein S8 [Sedimentisphaerales bacterium]
MSHADPIADMLTRIRNGVRVEREEVRVKASCICEGIAKVMTQQGYINGYDRIETASKQDMLRVQLKYGPLGEKIIREIKRCSKPSRRLYCSVDDIPNVMGGLGIAIISTSQGVLSDAECRERKIGGELLCTIC